MDPWRTVKEEDYVHLGAGSSSSSYGSAEASSKTTVPRPMEGLHDAGPPPFVTKTYEMVDDPNTFRAVSWSRGGQSFVVWDVHAFSSTLLPKYFKHNNFSSFVRQLNTYGFRKIDPDRWEFANEGFLMGHKHLLKYIRRRKISGQSMACSQQAVVPCVEPGQYGTDTEVIRLRQDKEVLMSELVNLRQHHQNTRAYLQAMEQRIRGTEEKQKRMMAFIARVVQNPIFIHQLVQQKEKRKGLGETVSGKRRWSIDQGCSQDVQGSNSILSRAESDALRDDGYEVSELEALALEIQGHSQARKARREEMEFRENIDKVLDEEFWEELLAGRLEIHHTEEVCEEDADVSLLADKLGYLGSSPE